MKIQGCFLGRKILETMLAERGVFTDDFRMRRSLRVGWSGVFAVACLWVSGCGETARVVEVVETEPSGIPLQTDPQRNADNALEQIHRKWVGTPWAYSGTTQVPRQGSIACGYFVTTTLRAAGKDIDRVRLAQAASEKMILKVTPLESIRRYRDRPLAEVLDGLRAQGEGYYIVGLDSHTGFLKVDRSGAVVFIHSAPGRGVAFEEPAKAPELARSRYRVTGKLVWP